MLEQSIKNFCAPVYARTKRNSSAYAATAAYVTGNLRRLVELYCTAENDMQTARLIRDDIDNALRRYHQYCIKGRIGAHYVEIGLEGNGIFEHMIPTSTVRDLLIAGVLTPEQACNVPTCRLSRERDDLLRAKGWVSRTPDVYRFWKRYEYCFDTQGVFSTWDGAPVDTAMTLLDHFENIAELQ